MTARLLARLALAAALVVAVQASLLHPLQHVDQKGSLVHVPGKDKTAGTACDMLSALGACAPEAPPALWTIEASEHPVALSQGAPRVAEAPPFLSQGPPTLL